MQKICFSTIVERGINYQLIKCYEKALADFNQAIKLEPESAKAVMLRGQTFNPHSALQFVTLIDYEQK